MASPKSAERARNLRAARGYETSKYGYYTIQTGVVEVVVRVYPDGSYQLMDMARAIEGGRVDYEGIARIPMPKNVALDYAIGSQWIWCSEYWSGIFPTEQLLVVCRYT